MKRKYVWIYFLFTTRRFVIQIFVPKQACDFVCYYVIYVNLSKMEVIYVIFFLEVMMLFS